MMDITNVECMKPRYSSCVYGNTTNVKHLFVKQISFSIKVKATQARNSIMTRIETLYYSCPSLLASNVFMGIKKMYDLLHVNT